MDAFATFDRAEGDLFDKVTTLNRTIHRDQLAHREAKLGRIPDVITDWVMLEAEELVRIAATTGDLESLDVAAFETQLRMFEVRLAAVVAAPPEKTKTELRKAFVQCAQDFDVAGRELLARAQARIKLTDVEQLMITAGDASAVVGTPAALVAAYNRCVKGP
jgi:hypothetical protein